MNQEPTHMSRVEAFARQMALEEQKRDAERNKFFKGIIVAASLLIIAIGILSYIKNNKPVYTPAVHYYHINK